MDKKISELDPVVSLAGTEPFPVVQSGDTKKATIANIATYFGSALFSSYTGALTASSLSLNQNISSPAWTINGIRHKNTSVTLTDTTSSGSVAIGYTNVFGGNTIAATNVTSFTDYATTYLSAPIAGTNVTIVNPYALWTAGNIRIVGATVTTSLPVLNITQTWNNAAISFTGIKVNFTNSASAVTSNILDLQVDNVSQCKIRKDGAVNYKHVITPNTGTIAPSAIDSGTTYTNEGDTDGSVISLPANAIGVDFTGVVMVAQLLTFTAAVNETIRIGTSVTATGGSISSSVIGSVIKLVKVNATSWVAVHVVGSWSI